MGSFWNLNPLIAISTLAKLDGGDRVATGALTSAPLILLLIYCGLIALSSMCGGALPLMIRLTHTRMQVLVSIVGGFMLGVGIFHQLPHAAVAMAAGGSDASDSLDWCMWWLMFGLLLTFFMLRMFHFHSHGPIDEDGPHEHDCSHDHDHDHSHDHGGGHSPLKGSSWIGIFLGLSLHTLLDGVALAANVQADAFHNHERGLFTLLGLGTFLGVALHKPLDSMSITSLMAAGGWSGRSMQLVNLGYAVMCPIGAFLFYFGIRHYGGVQETVVAAALAMSAGVFICISLSDLLPEVQFHSHDRWKLSAALLLGIGAAWVIGFLEPAHTHGQQHDHQVAPAVHGPDERQRAQE
jgi:zinc and cadmium transporter